MMIVELLMKVKVPFAFFFFGILDVIYYVHELTRITNSHSHATQGLFFFIKEKKRKREKGSRDWEFETNINNCSRSRVKKGTAQANWSKLFTRTLYSARVYLIPGTLVKA